MSYTFRNGSAVVTGAASGIGRAAAATLAAHGLFVVGLDVASSPGDGTKKFDDVVAEGELHRGDVTEADDVAMAVEAAEASGPIRAVVTCAGIGATGGLSAVDRSDLRETFAVHVEGTYETIKQAAPYLQERGTGAVVTTSSIAATLGWLGTTDYAPAKGAIESLTRQLASELSPDGVRVNAVSPGFIRTGMNADVWDPDTPEKESDRVDLSTAEDRTLLPWLGDPEDVGEVIAFLASEEAGFITGQILVVDGGWTVNAW